MKPIVERGIAEPDTGDGKQDAFLTTGRNDLNGPVWRDIKTNAAS